MSWIIGALEEAVAVGGLSAIGAGLYSIGIPKDSIVQYETTLKADKFLIVAHGTSDEVAKAKDILRITNSSGLTDHALAPTTNFVTT